MENNEKNVDLNDLLLHAIEQKPTEFKDAFNDLLTQRISDRLDQAKQEVAANYFMQDQGDEQDEAEEVSDDQESQEPTDEVEDGQDAETV
jgi:hypothetical protein